jgi:beta-mannanase
MPLPFEIYYPGDDLVDVVGYSALNQGLCPYSMHDYWFSPEQTVGFSLREMHRMAPDKPVFIVHLGTTAFTASGHSDTAAKDQWLRDTYSYLANDLNIRAVLYYNYPQSNPDCDWAVYRAGANPIQYAGYRDAAQDARYGYLSPTQLASADLTPQKGNEKTFLPLIRASNQQPVLLGSYTQEWPGAQKVVDAEYHAVDSWAGKHLSIAGTFVDILSDPVINIEMQLEMMWDNGYTPFVNLDVLSNSGITAKKIANGQVDTALRNVARSYAAMVQYNHQMAFFAPLQEMNGDWVSYGADPANFKLAYYRIQQIFADEGVPPGSVKWVFAPSGWSSAGDPPFEDYYPGDAYTDILGFSSYNSGYCVSDFNQGWLTPEETYHSFIHRMTLLAPTKPIFIAQTATTALTKQGKSVSAKNQWLVDAYNYLATYPSVRAVIYYNRWNSDCNWAFYQQGVDQYIGYPQGVANSAFGYISPFALKGMNFAWP